MSRVRPLRVGLTGGIGSGKSTVAAMFSELGVPVLDLDRVGRLLTEQDGDCLARLVAAFGKKILQTDGSLNRRALANHCFASAAETARLNAILHPLIRQQEDRWVKSQQAPYVIIEASVLIESGGVGRVDALVVVLADMDVRLKRVLARGDRSAVEFASIVERQCSDDERQRLADHLIENNDGLEQLRRCVGLLHEELRSAARG